MVQEVSKLTTAGNVEDICQEKCLPILAFSYILLLCISYGVLTGH